MIYNRCLPLGLLAALLPSLALAAPEAGEWVLRARALGVAPKEDASITGGVTGSSIDYGNSFGPALQAGADYMLDDHWMLNIDVKINGGAVRADVDINPWLVGVGVGYKFQEDPCAYSFLL